MSDCLMLYIGLCLDVAARGMMSQVRGNRPVSGVAGCVYSQRGDPTVCAIFLRDSYCAYCLKNSNDKKIRTR